MMSIRESAFILTMAVIGGFRNIFHAALGGVFLRVVLESLRDIGDWRLTVFDLIAVSGLVKTFGRVVALNEVSLAIVPGQARLTIAQSNLYRQRQSPTGEQRRLHDNYGTPRRRDTAHARAGVTEGRSSPPP